jgi:hypothetical protein
LLVPTLATSREKRILKPSKLHAQHENAVLANKEAKQTLSKSNDTKKKPRWFYVDEEGEAISTEKKTNTKQSEDKQPDIKAVQEKEAGPKATQGNESNLNVTVVKGQESELNATQGKESESDEPYVLSTDESSETSAEEIEYEDVRDCNIDVNQGLTHVIHLHNEACRYLATQDGPKSWPEGSHGC